MSKTTATVKPAKPQAAAILAIVALAAAVRLVELDASPPAINQDEAVHAYEAYCFRTMGQDHFGTSWPIFFRAYGRAEHHSAPFIWLLVPFQAVMGMNVWSTRLPPALLGTLNVWLVYLLVRRFYGQRTGLLAALMLAISPWHVHLSRMAFEVSICPTLVTLGVLLLVRVVREPMTRRRAMIELGCAGLIFGITLWTYNAMRLFVPLLLMGGMILYWRRVPAFLRRPGSWAAVSVGAVGFALTIAPFVWSSIKEPQKAWGRAAAVALFDPNAGAGDLLKRVAYTYWLHLSPWFFFVDGDPSIIQSVPGYGQLHYYCALLLPLGLWRVVWRWRAEPFGRWVLWWILVAPIPPALTELDAGHSLRSAGALPAYQILAAMGLDLALIWAAKRSLSWYRATWGLAGAAITVNAIYFGYLFFVRYPVEAAPYFQTEWVEVFKEIGPREAQYEAVMLTAHRTNQVGMLYLFWNNIEPKQYFALKRKVHEGEYFDFTYQIDKIRFLGIEYLDQIAPHLRAGARILIAERPEIPVQGTELKRFYFPDGQLALILYDVQTAKTP